MFDMTLRQWNEAVDEGPLAWDEIMEVVSQPAEHVPAKLMGRFLASLVCESGGGMRDCLMHKHEDIKWWASLTREVDGLDQFFAIPAAITAHFLLVEGRTDIAKDLLHKAVHVDNKCMLAVGLLTVIESGLTDKLKDAPALLAENFDEKVAAWNEFVAAFREEHKKAA